MMTADYRQHTFYFRQPAGTSRGILHRKVSFFILVSDQDRPGITGIGECSILPGLSPDDRNDLGETLKKACRNIGTTWENRHEILHEWPAVAAGIEMALKDSETGGRRLLYPSRFTDGETSIPIHGLIWMDTAEGMRRQIDEKLNQGYSVIKMKIGALPFDEEVRLIKHIREKSGDAGVEIRLDANGAFTPEEATRKLDRLAELNVHSLEQPIRPGQTKALAQLCRISPVPIAMDEELIGVSGPDRINDLLEQVKPHYLVLKPSLIGGLEAAGRWAEAASKQGCGWWINSALESGIGLNALAQWVAASGNQTVQGLGTGSLFTNNIPSPLSVGGGRLWHHPDRKWDLTALLTTAMP